MTFSRMLCSSIEQWRGVFNFYLSSGLISTTIVHRVVLISLNICLWQVMASKTKIYMVLELVDAGELFDKIVSFHDSDS